MLERVTVAGFALILFLSGCASPLECYKIESADTWVSGGPQSWESDSESNNRRGRTTDQTRSNGDGWSVDVGLNLHWGANSCDWVYVDEEKSPPPGNQKPGRSTPD